MQSVCSSQPEHSCIHFVTHLQLLHLPPKHLLPEFMEDLTKFADWIRAGAAFLFLNFNYFLAAVLKLFYSQSHFLCHFSLPFQTCEPFCRNCCFMVSCAPHIPFFHIFAALTPHPLSVPFLHSSPLPLLLNLRCADAAMLPPFLLAWGIPFFPKIHYPGTALRLLYIIGLSCKEQWSSKEKSKGDEKRLQDLGMIG